MSLEKQIFKNGSTTYYFSSKFFPKSIRQDVYKLYSFVRIADDYVDSIPQNKKEFKILRTLWDEAINTKNLNVEHAKTDSVNERVVKHMVYLTKKYDFDPSWVDSFFASMQADIDKKTYDSIDGTMWYVYGSAEVIGLMMAKIMGLPKNALKYAKLQGRAMQWINFIRDIEEDNKLGRRYFPQQDLDQFNLKDLRKQTAQAKPKEFQDFIRFEIRRYNTWQREAEKGKHLIPNSVRIALETATENFNWTARKLGNNPVLIYEKKVKPSRIRVVATGIRKTF